MSDEAETERVSFTIANLRLLSTKRIFALVDVEVRVADLSFWIMGIQGRRTLDGSAVVQLPTYRDVNGLAKPAVVMPEELRKPLTDAVLEFLAEEGAIRRRRIPRWTQ